MKFRSPPLSIVQIGPVLPTEYTVKPEAISKRNRRNRIKYVVDASGAWPAT